MDRLWKEWRALATDARSLNCRPSKFRSELLSPIMLCVKGCCNVEVEVMAGIRRNYPLIRARDGHKVAQMDSYPDQICFL